MIRLVIMASGSGTNAENIIKYFKAVEDIEVSYVLTNNSNAGVIKKADVLGVRTRVFSRKEFYSEDGITKFLRKEADFIILAGFLWKVPQEIIATFPNRIVNIHPALLPKYGGKGMYGMHIHNAVVNNREKETGISIHYVNENYDEGAIIFQAKTSLNESDSVEIIAKKIHLLEQRYFPKVIEEVILGTHG